VRPCLKTKQKEQRFILLMALEAGESKSMAVASGEGLLASSQHGREHHIGKAE
jgi:hypothetical protein